MSNQDVTRWTLCLEYLDLGYLGRLRMLVLGDEVGGTLGEHEAEGGGQRA